jgi:hypothetical protein
MKENPVLHSMKEKSVFQSMKEKPVFHSIYSINKTDRCDITEILLKVELNTINLT